MRSRTTAGLSNATAGEMDMLKKAAIQAGIETQFSPTEAVKGLNELAQAGYSAKESVDLLRPSHHPREKLRDIPRFVAREMINVELQVLRQQFANENRFAEEAGR